MKIESAGGSSGRGVETVALGVQRELDDLHLRLKGLVHVRAILEVRGARQADLDRHTAEIDNVRARVAELVGAAGDGYDAAAA